MNPFCTFNLSGSCRFGNKCVNRHENQSLVKSGAEYPLLGFGAAGISRQQVQQTPTIESTIEPTIEPITESYNDCQSVVLFTGPNKKNKKKGKPKKDLKTRRKEKTKLHKILIRIENEMFKLHNSFLEEQSNSLNVAEEFNKELLDDDNFHCNVCHEVFIQPVLLQCSHMFCEWCMDKWLEKYDHCPLCRVGIVGYTHCLNMKNFIQKKIDGLPTFKLQFDDLKVTRAKDKERSIKARADRKQQEFIARSLNERMSGRSANSS